MPIYNINGELFDTGNNQFANCHKTAYRFINNLGFEPIGLDGDVIINELWPNGYVAANRITSIDEENVEGDISTINPGDIIGFWTNANGQFVLQHTMIAQFYNIWIGTNNIGTMAQDDFQIFYMDRRLWAANDDHVGWFRLNNDLFWHHSHDQNPPILPLYVTKGGRL